MAAIEQVAEVLQAKEAFWMTTPSADSTKADIPQAIWLFQVAEDTYHKMIAMEVKMLEAAIEEGA